MILTFIIILTIVSVLLIVLGFACESADSILTGLLLAGMDMLFIYIYKTEQAKESPEIEISTTQQQKEESMILRLTTPGEFDRLVEYLEKERGLVWPTFDGSTQKFRDFFIEYVKQLMASDTTFVEVEWKFNHGNNRLEASMRAFTYGEIQTDGEYLKEVDSGPAE